MNELCNVSFCKTPFRASISDDTEKIGTTIPPNFSLVSNVSSLGYPLLNPSTSHQNAFADSVIIVANLKSDEYQIKPKLPLHSPTLVESQSSNGEPSHSDRSKATNDETSSMSLPSLVETEEESCSDVNLSVQGSWDKNVKQLMSVFAELCLQSIYFHAKCSNDNVEHLARIKINLETRTLQLIFKESSTVHLPLSEITLLNDDDFQKTVTSNSTRTILCCVQSMAV